MLTLGVAAAQGHGDKVVNATYSLICRILTASDDRDGAGVDADTAGVAELRAMGTKS